MKLFPVLRVSSPGYHSVTFSKWFSRFLKSARAAIEKTCFHRFRHNFGDALRDGEVSREIALQLGGSTSSAGASAIADIYGTGFRVRELAEEIAKVSYPRLNLAHLHRNEEGELTGFGESNNEWKLGQRPISSSEMSSAKEQFSLFGTPQDAAEEEQKSSVRPSGDQSNFIVYVDESGDHGMQTLDQNYPIFVLAFCVFYKRHYSEKVVPAIEKFKFNRFGHDIVILHERDIRKEVSPFKFANEAEKTSLSANSARSSRRAILF